MAAKTPGLFLRGGVYYVRIVLPLDHPLRQQYRSGRVVHSLGACGRREAALQGLRKRIDVLGGGADSHAPQPAVSPPIQPPSSAAAGGVGVRLREVFDRWRKAKRRTDDAVAACGRALALFERQTQDPDIGQLTRAQGDAFRAWLLAQKTTTKTARDRFTWVKSLLKFAQQDLGLLTSSPWAGLDIASRPGVRRRPWSDDELATLFGHEIWREGRLPTQPKAGGIAAYWLPLLALYTGARCGELCQLTVADVLTDADVPSIRIADDGEGQRVKSAAGRRLVPLHGELIRLGFLDYVRSLTGAELWPALPRRKGKPGGFFSAYFTTLRQSLGIRPQVVFHSFRHNVRTSLSEAGVAETTIDRLLGHAPAGSIGARSYTHINSTTLSAAVTCLRFPTEQLPVWSRLFRLWADEVARRKHVGQREGPSAGAEVSMP